LSAEAEFDFEVQEGKH